MPFWDRARQGQPTLVRGRLGPAPAGIQIVRGTCDDASGGLIELARAHPQLPPHPVESFTSPVYRRLLEGISPPQPGAGLFDLTRYVFVLEEVDRADFTTIEVISRWVSQEPRLPLLLTTTKESPLHAVLREHYGDAAIRDGIEPLTEWSELPVEAIAAGLRIAERGPIPLEELAITLQQPQLYVEAALHKARLLGFPICERAGFLALPEPVLTQLRQDRLIEPTIQRSPRALLPEAHCLAIIGAWEAADARYASEPSSSLERCALHWAAGKYNAASALLPPQSIATLTLAWDQGAPLQELLTHCQLLPEPDRSLSMSAAYAHAGSTREARAMLVPKLETLPITARLTALHLLAKAPIYGDTDLVSARQYLALAEQLHPSEAVEARLTETAARLRLRARNVRQAASLFADAAAKLYNTSQYTLFARAVTGYATTADLAIRSRRALDWLEEAILINRSSPTGLAWCARALDTLLDRVDYTDTDAETILRRRSMELRGLRSQLPPPPPLETL